MHRGALRRLRERRTQGQTRTPDTFKALAETLAQRVDRRAAPHREHRAASTHTARCALIATRTTHTSTSGGEGRVSDPIRPHSERLAYLKRSRSASIAAPIPAASTGIASTHVKRHLEGTTPAPQAWDHPIPPPASRATTMDHPHHGEGTTPRRPRR